MQSDGLIAAGICHSPLVTADESASLADVSRLMREHNIGDVVITRSGYFEDSPIGVVTDRDIVVHGIACDVDLNEITAGDLSAQELITVGASADVFEIVSTMNKNAVRRVVVRDGSNFIGIVSLDDILRALFVFVGNLTAITERQIQQGMTTD